jgi:hypothetical protein
MGKRRNGGGRGGGGGRGRGGGGDDDEGGGGGGGGGFSDQYGDGWSGNHRDDDSRGGGRGRGPSGGGRGTGGGDAGGKKGGGGPNLTYQRQLPKFLQPHAHLMTRPGTVDEEAPVVEGAAALRFRLHSFTHIYACMCASLR